MIRRTVSSVSGCCALAVCMLALTGCESMKQTWRKGMHELKPHRLARWNQGPGPSSTANFSIEDPIPELEARYSPQEPLTEFPTRKPEAKE